MKYVLSVFSLLTAMLQAQETPKTPAVQVLSRIVQDKILLRWAVDEPLAWKTANAYGFLIEKSTISRNDKAVIPIEKQMLTALPLKPRPLAEWETLATQDQNAAIIAQALYGDRFETTAPNTDYLGGIYAINDELEQRFTFALLAAEQNYKAAKLAGWAFEDSTGKQGESYSYTISVAIPPEIALTITNGTLYTSLTTFETLPKPIDFMGLFEDTRVTFHWNFHLLQHVYTHYVVERSENNQDFKQLNGVPVFSTQNSRTSTNNTLSYSDSIPNNKTFYYRIKGKTAFDETGPSSDIISGKALKRLNFSPRISTKEIVNDTTAILNWEFDKKGNEWITGFEVRSSNNDKGPFKTIKQKIPPTERKTSIHGLRRVNYFTIVALGKNGIESASYPTLVQPADTTPPAAPSGLKAVLDTTGILQLTWDKNSEEDLKGYRIFKSNDRNAEFSEITKTTYKKEIFIDSISIKNLNDTLYFKLKAEDQRYNRSDFSELLVVDKPDITAPSPPLFKNYKVGVDGIEIKWISSSSTDVISHILFRKNNADPQGLWEELMESKMLTDSIYVDTSIATAGQYSYTMIAKDRVGHESLPTDLLTVTWNGKEMVQEAIEFSGIVDRELRSIHLLWRTKDVAILEYRLYRGTNENALKLYKTLDGTSKGYNDPSLEINTRYTYGLQLVLRGGRTSLIKTIDLKY